MKRIILFGPSGSGKTTILNKLANKLRSEKIYFNHLDDKLVGIKKINAEQNLKFKENLFKARKIEPLFDHKKVKFSKMSGGEKQKLIIDREIVDGGIILIDEPTNNLDDKATKELVKKLANINEETTVVIATHDKRIINGDDLIYHITNEKVDVITDEIFSTITTKNTLTKHEWNWIAKHYSNKKTILGYMVALLIPITLLFCVIYFTFASYEMVQTEVQSGYSGSRIPVWKNYNGAYKNPLYDQISGNGDLDDDYHYTNEEIAELTAFNNYACVWVSNTVTINVKDFEKLKPFQLGEYYANSEFYKDTENVYILNAIANDAVIDPSQEVYQDIYTNEPCLLMGNTIDENEIIAGSNEVGYGDVVIPGFLATWLFGSEENAIGKQIIFTTNWFDEIIEIPFTVVGVGSYHTRIYVQDMSYIYDILKPTPEQVDAISNSWGDVTFHINGINQAKSITEQLDASEINTISFNPYYVYENALNNLIKFACLTIIIITIVYIIILLILNYIKKALKFSDNSEITLLSNWGLNKKEIRNLNIKLDLYHIFIATLFFVMLFALLAFMNVIFIVCLLATLLAAIVLILVKIPFWIWGAKC